MVITPILGACPGRVLYFIGIRCSILLAVIYFPLVDAEFDRALLFFIDEQRSSSCRHSALPVLRTSADGVAHISGRIEIAVSIVFRFLEC